MIITRKSFFNIMACNLGNSCSVLQHTCNHGVVDYSVANSILEQGIKIDNSWCIRRTCMPFGVLSELDDEFKKRFFTDYNIYSTDECINIVVAVPLFFIDSNQNTYFGGAICTNSQGISNDDITTYIEFEMQQRKIVPKEFILGYYKNTSDSKIINFTFNPKFYSFLTQEEKNKFIRDFNIDNFFNLNGDIEKQIEKIDENISFFSSSNDKKNLELYLCQIKSILMNCLYSKEINIDVEDFTKSKNKNRLQA